MLLLSVKYFVSECVTVRMKGVGKDCTQTSAWLFYLFINFLLLRERGLC